MLEKSGDEATRRPVGLTESRENAFIIALTMKATGSSAFATLEAICGLYIVGFYWKNRRRTRQGCR
jgi:hypothetical protein